MLDRFNLLDKDWNGISIAPSGMVNMQLLKRHSGAKVIANTPCVPRMRRWLEISSCQQLGWHLCFVVPTVFMTSGCDSRLLGVLCCRWFPAKSDSQQVANEFGGSL